MTDLLIIFVFLTNQDENILITGGAFIGSHVVRLL